MLINDVIVESYAAKDQIYDRYNDLSAHKDNPAVKAQLDKAQDCWSNNDSFKASWDACWITWKGSSNISWNS